MKMLIAQLEWYRRKHGLLTLARLAGTKVINRWLITSEYLFVVDLIDDKRSQLRQFEPISIASYHSMADVPADDLRSIMNAKGSAVALPFLNDFFSRGARLWLASDQGNVVGLKWTMLGGEAGFYSIPIGENEAISMAEEIFQPYRGRNLWQRFTATLTRDLRSEGVSRVYFKVHCRNHSMLRAVSKTDIAKLGLVTTFRLPRYYVTIWNRRVSTVNKRCAPSRKAAVCGK